MRGVFLSAFVGALIGGVIGLPYPEDARGAALRIPVAERAILTYEHTYWHGSHADVSLGHCERHSPQQVSCIVHVQRGASTLTIRDWATRTQGAIRVHPGSSFEEVRQLS